MKYILPILVMMSILIVGCAQTDPLAGYCEEGEEPVVECKETENESTVDDLKDKLEDTEDKTDEEKEQEKTENKTVEKEERTENKTAEKDEEKEQETEFADVREYKEGDLVSFSDVKVTDPDGDPIELSFSEPLNEDGEWQTEQGDAGQYVSTITASDGEIEVSKQVKIVVEGVNEAPVIDVQDEITVDEGETVSIEPSVTDPEGDSVEVSFSGWMDSEEYTTNYDDAGEYTVTVTATDGKNSVEEEVTVVVNDVNRAPELEKPSYDIIAEEGEEIELSLSADDPDGDDVTLSYSEPFSEEGTWQTEEGDAGEYTVTVTASDGDKESSIELPVVVESLNKAPVIDVQDEITVDEGETVSIDPSVTDPEGDSVEVSFSGWMDSSEYETNYNDSGEHTVTVTASDGEDSSSKDVTVTVNNVNREPEFTWE
ncbi:MAG: Ig-like domain-containing protein [Nanobdellota archaeon]